MRMLAAQGVRTSINGLPPVVHGESDRNGFLPWLIKTACKEGESACVGDGLNRWPTKRFSLVLVNPCLPEGLACKQNSR